MDNRVRVIVAHPARADASRVHKRWVAELAKHPDEFVVRDLYALYPDGTLDEAAIEAEHALLDEHDTIVFQFPVYWYSSPALLRTWTDAVYGFGWAYGGDQAAPGEPGRKLAGKHFSLALSAGDIEANYCEAGTVGFTYSQIIIPFHGQLRGRHLRPRAVRALRHRKRLDRRGARGEHDGLCGVAARTVTSRTSLHLAPSCRMKTAAPRGGRFHASGNRPRCHMNWEL